MIYRVRYELNGELSGMPYVEPGDVLKTEKSLRIKVLSKWYHEGELVQDTDVLVLIYPQELERV